MSSSCLCGCCGLTTNPGCAYSDSGRTQDERECSASGVNDIGTLTQIWSSTNCVQVYEDILYDGPNDVLEYNPANLPRVQSDIYNLFEAYLRYGFTFTDSVVSSGYNSFQQQLVNLCSSPLVPGGCDLFLSNYCSQYTRDQIGSDSVLASLCGCYAPLLYPTDTVAPQCDSMCHLSSTAQLSNPCTGVIDRCSNTVCVIDNVNISLVNTDTATAFQQICPACDQTGSDPCTCIIGGTNVSSTLNEAGVSATYTQYCGENATCYQEDDAGNLTQVQCPPADSGFDAPTYVFPIVLVVVLVVVATIIIIAMVATRSKRQVETPSDEPWKPPPSTEGRKSSLDF